MLFCRGVHYWCSRMLHCYVYPTRSAGPSILRHKGANIQVQLVIFLLLLVGQRFDYREVDLFCSLRDLNFGFGLSRQLPKDLVDYGIVVEVPGI